MHCLFVCLSICLMRVLKLWGSEARISSHAQCQARAARHAYRLGGGEHTKHTGTQSTLPDAGMAHRAWRFNGLTPPGQPSLPGPPSREGTPAGTARHPPAQQWISPAAWAPPTCMQFQSVVDNKISPIPAVHPQTHRPRGARAPLLGGCSSHAAHGQPGGPRRHRAALRRRNAALKCCSVHCATLQGVLWSGRAGERCDCSGGDDCPDELDKLSAQGAAKGRANNAQFAQECRLLPAAVNVVCSCWRPGEASWVITCFSLA